MSRNVGRPDRADLHVTRRPNDLRLVPGLERDDIGQFGWAACKTGVVLRAALGDFTGLEECITNMRNEFPTAVGEPQRRAALREAATMHA
jgi:hypothetical protein